MTTGELLELFRVEMNDVPKPQLWSDDFIFGAMDSAQTWFTRWTDGIPDSTTPAVTDLAVLAGTGEYPLHKAVLKLRTARRADNGRPVEVCNEEDLATQNRYFDNVPGVLRALVMGMDESTVRTWPLPMEDTPVKLSVFRLPLVRITDDQAFEIAEQHHRELLLWMKHLAYSVQDAETFDRTKAADFESRFKDYCFKVKLEQGRLRHKPRSVQYGGL